MTIKVTYSNFEAAQRRDMPGPMSSEDILVVFKQKYFKQMYKLEFNVPREFDFVRSWFSKKNNIYVI